MVKAFTKVAHHSNQDITFLKNESTLHMLILPESMVLLEVHLLHLSLKIVKPKHIFPPQLSLNLLSYNIPFSVQQPSRVTTLGWEPNSCKIPSSRSRSSLSLVLADSLTDLTATSRVKPSCPDMSSASAFHT